MASLTHFQSRSGRIHSINWRTAAAWLVMALLIILAVLLTVTLYTPTLHHLADDFVGGTPDQYPAKFYADNRAAIINVITAEEPPLDRLSLAAMDLRVVKNAFDTLNTDIVTYGFGNTKLQTKPRVNARSRVNGVSYPVSLRYRGTNSWHHQYWKPSLRVKYKNQQVIDGRRDHVLIAPEDGIGMRNWLSTELAKQWQVLGNRESFQLLFINRQFFGLYTNVWRFDESLLIDEGLLPGPFFRLENATGPAFRRTSASFWDPNTWEIDGIERGPGNRLLATLLDVLKTPDPNQRHAQLRDMVHAESFAKYLAILAHAASIHVNEHNVALWLDTTDGLLRPAVIDVNGYDWSHPGNLQLPVTSIQFPLAKIWLEDPRNLALYVAKLYELVTTFGSVEQVQQLLKHNWRLIRPYLVSDLHFSDMGVSNGTYTRSILPVTSVDDNFNALLKAVEIRGDYLQQVLADTRLRLVEQQQGQFKVQLTGPMGVSVTRKDGAAFHVNNVLHRDSVPLHPLLRRGAPPGAVFWISGKPADYRWVQQHSNQPLTLTPLGADVAVLKPGQLDQTPAPLAPAIIGPGHISWSQTRDFPPGQTVIINAGTTISLGARQSIYIQGDLQINGTRQQPVVIQPQNPQQPFGSVVVRGPGCQVSVKHLQIQGGSVAQRLNLHQSGMFSIRDCARFTIEHSQFGRNVTGDDGLHVLRSTGDIRHSSFANANSDAIDWDAVVGTISHSSFQNSGNDSIDVSMSRVTLKHNQFAACGDKCLSVGEGSRVWADHFDVQGCAIGVAVKDQSEAVLTNATIADCDKALAVYRKKWRWETGGTLFVADTRLSDSVSAAFDIDEFSSAFVDDISIVPDNPLISSPAEPYQSLAIEEWPSWTHP